MSKLYLNYDETNKMIAQLINIIKNCRIVLGKVVGIKNGGLNVSKPIAEALDLPHKEILISYYDNADHIGDSPIVDMGDFKPSFGVLLVDDLIDSGATLKYFKDTTGMTQGDQFYVATLHWNKKGKFGQKPDFYIAEKTEWIVYPWEASELCHDK